MFDSAVERSVNASSSNCQPTEAWTTPRHAGDYRHKRELARDDRHVVDEILYSVANHGDAPVEVTIEEELRYPGAAVVRFERPAAGEGGGALKRDRWRRVVTVAPDGVARGAVVVQYRTPQP